MERRIAFDWFHLPRSDPLGWDLLGVKLTAALVFRVPRWIARRWPRVKL